MQHVPWCVCVLAAAALSARQEWQIPLNPQQRRWWQQLWPEKDSLGQTGRQKERLRDIERDRGKHTKGHTETTQERLIDRDRDRLRQTKVRTEEATKVRREFRTAARTEIATY